MKFNFQTPAGQLTMLLRRPAFSLHGGDGRETFKQVSFRLTHRFAGLKNCTADLRVDRRTQFLAVSVSRRFLQRLGLVLAV